MESASACQHYFSLCSASNESRWTSPTVLFLHSPRCSSRESDDRCGIISRCLYELKWNPEKCLPGSLPFRISSHSFVSDFCLFLLFPSNTADMKLLSLS